MGGCLAIQVSCDKVLGRLGSYLCGKDNYICYLKKNLKALKIAMEDLAATRDNVLRRVELAERQGQLRLRTVQVWLTRVETIENRFNDLYSTITVELQRSCCCCGVCSKRLRLSYRYGRRILVMLKDVKDLESRGVFEVVAMEMPSRPTIFRRILNMAWNHLTNVGTGIMGLYGRGGVGKSTLLTQINNMFSDSNNEVDVSILVEVPRDKHARSIQDEIAKKLGMGGEEWNKKNQNEKAEVICNSLRNKRFVLLLDNIRGKVDLAEIGVPLPTMENECKVAFTTRSREVCHQMGVDSPMLVTSLESQDAWDLFKTKIEERTLRSHPDISELARKVVEKCRGLPLALNIIGETMTRKTTVREWRRAIDVLSSNAREFLGLEDEILPILKYSYDNLQGEQVKLCLLYCSLFPEGNRIEKEKLVEYWKSEGFIDENEGREEREVNRGYEILGTLIRACLLLEDEDNKSYVRMHDVVREMALWIETDFGKQKERCIVQAGVGLREIPPVKDWSSVRKMSLMDNDIEEISESPDCLELKTLLLRRNHQLVNISGEFFRFMPKLVVLDLSWNQILHRLPEEISNLVSLRYLDLSRTGIDQLPIGLQELKTLIYLNLEWTLRLESISGISKLRRLRTLRLQKSKMIPDVNLVNELVLLKDLQVLTIEVSSSLVAHQLLSSHRLVHCIKELDFKYLEELLLTLPTMGSLSGIRILSCGVEEIEIVRTSSWKKIPPSPCFVNLSSVLISNCNGLKDLTWLLFAPSLTDLEVSSSDQLEDIISEEKAVTSLTEAETGIFIPFPKLEKLTLWILPKLKSIYWNTLPFPYLREIDINKCPNLRKLALDSQSVVKVDQLVINYREKEWIENIEWEDEATQLRFLPFSKTLKLIFSKVRLDMRLMKELQLLEDLEFVSVSISSSLVEELLLYDPRVGSCIQLLSIDELPGESVGVLVLPAMDNLRRVYIKECGMREIKIEKTPWNKNPTSPRFSNLSDVTIYGCHGLKDLTWLLFAPNLTDLYVALSKQLEEIISKEKAASVLEKETCNILPFHKLEQLVLLGLPELKSIYWNALPFQHLRSIRIEGDCPKLRKLPLDSKSVFRVEDFKLVYEEEEWIKGIEWEDDATKHRFLPSYKLRVPGES